MGMLLTSCSCHVIQVFKAWVAALKAMSVTCKSWQEAQLTLRIVDERHMQRQWAAMHEQAV